MEGQFSDAEEDCQHVTFQRGKPLTMPRELESFENLTVDNLVNEADESDDFSDDGFYETHIASGISSINAVSVGNFSCQDKTSKVSDYQPPDKIFKRYLNKINVDKFEGLHLPGNVGNSLLESNRKADAEKNRRKDKHDRATVEQVLDPRTRMIVFKLLNRGTITNINGCVSTGKEANVYHASGKDDEEYAIKIYKTSIMIFKDREKYVSGEFRFRNGFCKHNPRKMIRTWAEKEIRNLSRLHSAGIVVPQPILLRSHVLLMQFVGHNGWPAPKLKDADLTTSRACKLYRECVIMMWKMFNKSKLVHADLSEFNLLYYEGQIYVIDVSQSVENDHPHALEFLRKDCTNINEFFRKKDVATMTVKELFDFITDPTVTETNMEEYLDRVSEIAAVRTIEERTAQELIDEEVFKKAYIPKTLREVVDAERDIMNAKKGDASLVYKTIVGMKDDLSEPQKVPEILLNSGASSSSEDDACDEETEKSNFVDSARPRDESPNSKKLRKKAVKEKQAENRKTKMKKSEKKRLEKKGKKNK
ncbi:Serine/threonine-protein kinase RIO1 [Gryllus bimaculatus]|nr:Serine/threonine-protein kinase RIO1 [Gryllus bimaculatus]